MLLQKILNKKNPLKLSNKAYIVYGLEDISENDQIQVTLNEV